MGIDWLKIFHQSVDSAAKQVMKIYDSDKRTVEISRGYGGDMTLAADKASEDIIIEKLQQVPAAVRIISEERGDFTTGDAPEFTVLLDPLDGSFNYKNGILYFGISIFVMDKDYRPVAAFVRDVPRGTEYAATFEGAFKNNKKLKKIQKKHNARSLLVEFSKHRNSKDMDFILRTIMKMRKIRAPGAIAIDLCSVAEGTFDALISSGGSRYLDIAAGIYILEQAGGIVTNFNGSRNIREGTQLKSENILAAANSGIHKFILG